MARLSDKRRQRIKNRARKEVARETAGAGIAARQSIGAANREYGRSVADARGADKVMRNELAEMLGTIKASGLKGKYAAQTAAELRSRMAASSSAVPFAIQEAGSTRQEAVSEAMADLQQARLDRRAAVGERTTDLLEEARDAKQERIDDRKEKMEEAGKGGISRGVKNAMIVANNYLQAAEAKDGQEGVAKLLSNKGMFIQGVAKEAESADGVDARKAVALVVRRYQRGAIKNTLENFYGPGSFDRKRNQPKPVAGQRRR
jgi:hypothetical protein